MGFSVPLIRSFKNGLQMEGSTRAILSELFRRPPGRRRIDKRRGKSYGIEAGKEDRYLVDKEPPGREGGFREE